MRVAVGEMGPTDKEFCFLRCRTNKYFMTELSQLIQLSQPIYIHDRIYDCPNPCGKNPEISAFLVLSLRGPDLGCVTGIIMFSQGMNSPKPAESSKHNQDVVMPGFRFHPTEEELVEFYLRRKVEGKHFNIELITFVDLYRYDPWELPGLAAIGEKEWFFYVPRDRKYRNGDRPNRVTASGYWKATGADRMIRDDNNCCIGLKKTLVFYRGKAPKGKRTSWIMNEYRLPQLETQRLHKQNELSLCRVYKKAGQDEGRLEAKESHSLPATVNENGEFSLAAITESFNRRPCQGNSSEFVKLQELPVALANHDNNGREMKCKLIVDERFAGPMEFADAELENMQARIASESTWSLYPRAPHPTLEDLYNPCPPQLVVAYNTASLPPCSDKLWEWNPVRNNGAPC